ncbi:MAG TPA: hypothetical protein VJ302_15235 [Blastocatellia bacterium]|nr:hypothetical protein [Blastocatellia bacterium]
MNPNQRREETQAMAALYALGVLDPSDAEMFETQMMGGVDGIDDDLAVFQFLVAAIGLSAPEQQPSESIRKRLCARVASFTEKNSTASRRFAVSPLATLRADEGEWVEISSGVLVKLLFTDEADSTVTTLVRLKPGARMESRFRRSLEQWYVLEGDCWVGSQKLGPGDFYLVTPGTLNNVMTTEKGTLSLIVSPARHGRL